MKKMGKAVVMGNLIAQMGYIKSLIFQGE